MTCGTLSVLLLNDRGINVFQFLSTLKRVLMKQNADSTKEAFLLSTEMGVKDTEMGSIYGKVYNKII